MTRTCKRCGCTDATTWVGNNERRLLCGPCWRATEPLPEEPEPVAETKPTRRAVASRSLGLDGGKQ